MLDEQQAWQMTITGALAVIADLASAEVAVVVHRDGGAFQDRSVMNTDQRHIAVVTLGCMDC